MNRRQQKLGFLIVIFLITLFPMICNSCKQESAESWIKRKFEIALPFKIDSRNIIKQERECFIAVQLTPEQCKKMLKNNFIQNGFVGWKVFKKNRSLGIKETYSIKETDKVFVNYKKSQGNYKLDPPWNTIALYLDVDNNVLIFEWGITYGC